MTNLLTTIMTRLIVLSLGFSLITACQKKRSPEFRQGDGEYIYSLADFNGASFSLRTGKSVAPGIAADADELVLKDGNSVIRSFDSVSFESNLDITKLDSEALSEFNFFGKEDYTYELEVGFTENHMIVYKVAASQDIPSNEMTYSIPAANGMTKVPLIGYPLSKYVIEYIKDSRGKKTQQKTSIPKDFLAESTHFSISTSSPVYFDAKEKLNLLPSSFFDEKGEWFYEVTLVDGPLNARLGSQLQSGKAKFFRTSNSLMAVDVNIPEEVADVSGEKLPKVMQLPVNWVDFELVESGSSAFLSEKQLDEKDAGASEWQDRNWGLFDLKRINSLNSSNTNSIRVRRLEVDDNYLSIVVSNSNNGVAIHYSFAKDASKIVGQTYPALDQKRFGFWQAERSVYNGSLTGASKAVEKNLFLSRMHPETTNNVIEVFLTDNTPDNPVFVRAITDAMNAWDAAFVEAARGSGKEPIRIKLNLDRRVKNGDVRYNKVSFYDFNINVGGLLGYGPSVADQRNGHVFSSTNHIYLRTYREGVYSDLKAYIRHRLGLYADKQPDGIKFPNQILLNTANINTSFDALVVSQGSMFNLEPMSTNSSSMKNDMANVELIKNLSFADSIERAEANIELKTNGNQSKIGDAKDLKALISEHKHTLNKNGACEYKAALANTFEEITKLCSGLRFGDYVNDLISQKETLDLDQLEFPKEIFNECAIVLLEPTLKSTLVHEFGHNLGLTHNFKGSSDNKNFRRDENGTPISRSTSVMDYPDSDSDRGFFPGPYDVAAIRYGYYQMVELNEIDANGQSAVTSIASNDPSDTRPIEERVENPEDLKNYLYCWDLDIIGPQVPFEDPSCRRWDRGSNPVQMAYAMMDRFNATSTMYMNRFENLKLGDPSYSLYGRNLLPMKTIFVKYRYLLHLKTKQLNDPYFVKNEADFKQFISTNVGDVTVEDLPKDTAELETFVEGLSELQQYKLASDIIYNFLKEVAFSETQYCTVWNKLDDGKLEFDSAKPFSQHRTNIFVNNKVSVDSCEEAASFISTDNQVVKTFGNRFDNLKYSADEEVISTKEDLSRGFGKIRLMAFELLTSRNELMNIFGQLYSIPALVVAANNDFRPSFMDNPIFRNDLVSTFEDRMVNGVSLSRITSNVEGAVAAEGFLPQYTEEQEFLESMYPNLINSMFAPGENAASRLNNLKADVYSRADFERIFADDVEKIAFVNDISGNYFVAEDPSSTIFRLIKSFKKTSNIIQNESMLYDLVNNKDSAIAAASRLHDAWFTENNKAPELNVNLVKLAAISRASQILASEYIVAEEKPEADEAVAEEAPAPAVEEPNFDDDLKFELVSTMVKDARPYLDYAEARGVKITQDLITDTLLKVADAENLEEYSIYNVVALSKVNEKPYLNLAFGIISQALLMESQGQYNPASPEMKEQLISLMYEATVKQLSEASPSSEELSELAAQESILRRIILR